MSTRVKRPAFWRPLVLAVALLGFQGYLGYSVFNGQFGTQSHEQLQKDISLLEGESNALGAKIEAYKLRAALFNPERLDPDILTERARALLNMARENDLVVLVEPEASKPRSGLPDQLAADKLTSFIEAISE